MKRIILAYMLIIASSAFAGGTVIRNGGDPSEPAFIDIAGNIAEWIRSGNADTLKLPENISLSFYKSKMLMALGSYHISFTPDRIFVGRAEKTCQNFLDEAGEFQIVCNIGRFSEGLKNDINDIYRTIHHEFAGLSGLEVNTGQDSDYRISDQISGYLRDEVVKRLPVMNSKEVGSLMGKGVAMSIAIGNDANITPGGIVMPEWYLVISPTDVTPEVHIVCNDRFGRNQFWVEVLEKGSREKSVDTFARQPYFKPFFEGDCNQLMHRLKSEIGNLKSVGQLYLNFSEQKMEIR